MYKRNALGKCSKQSHGVIVDKYRQKKKGWYIKYSYRADGKNYFSSESLTGDNIGFSVGDTIEISYACTNPDLSTYKRLQQ